MAIQEKQRIKCTIVSKNLLEIALCLSASTIIPSRGYHLAVKIIKERHTPQSRNTRKKLTLHRPKYNKN